VASGSTPPAGKSRRSNCSGIGATLHMRSKSCFVNNELHAIEGAPPRR
jgi:hypothetical protein